MFILNNRALWLIHKESQNTIGYDVMCFIIHPCDPTVVICYLI